MADLTVKAVHHSYRLHRILLVRSPFFERLLRDQADGSTSTTTSIDLPIDDPTLPGNPITSEALSICFAYLYGAPVFSHIKTGNAHAVLACAHRLELTTLCELCTGFMVKTLAPDTVAACVDFVAGNGSGASLGVYTAQLRQGCLDVLCAQLPAGKPAAVFDTTTADAAAEEQRQILVAAFERLPFAWIKEIIETKLVGPSEFEKFTFAKLLIERRKRVARASVTTGAPTAATNETVVLLFDQDAKGRVSLAEQLVKKPFSRQHSAHAH